MEYLHRRVSADAAIGIFLVASLAWGILAQHIYMQVRHMSPAGWDSFLFGQVTSISPQYTLAAVMVCTAVLLVVTFSSIGLPGLNGFVGEFLILLGAFNASPPWAAAAATGVILGAIYMLWMFRRVIFGPLTNPENQKLQDLNGREILILAPVLALIVFMGVYPEPFLSRMKPAVDLTLKRVFAIQGTPTAVNQVTGAETKNDGR